MKMKWLAKFWAGFLDLKVWIKSILNTPLGITKSEKRLAIAGIIVAIQVLILYKIKTMLDKAFFEKLFENSHK